MFFILNDCVFLCLGQCSFFFLLGRPSEAANISSRVEFLNGMLAKTLGDRKFTAVLGSGS